ncbi:hypothetical protein L0F51_03875 [Afifella sp. H1R]|uniref:hypothetical protein n=1 Tax=Afifella sp. H1R TaxID=2908841 RepID=UPI001F48496A|nr:hypothetical protein [Afifella sp. H1R]MCF1502904.1 hypothetical protein [Afifella sp. H1R]
MATYKPTKTYDVKFTRPVTWRGVKLTALPVHQMTGKVLTAIVAEHGEDVVDRADPR